MILAKTTIVAALILPIAIAQLTQIVAAYLPQTKAAFNITNRGRVNANHGKSLLQVVTAITLLASYC